MTSRRARLALVGLVFATAVGLWLFLRGGDEDPRAAVERALETAAAAATARDLGGVMEVVGERFAGEGMDRDELQGFLFVQLHRGAWRRVALFDTTVELEPGEDPRTARIETRAALASGDEIGSIEDLARTETGVWLLRLRFELDDDDAWRVAGARWERWTP